MSKTKTVFICSECGYSTPKWQGKCSNCDAWNTLIEKEQTKQKTTKTSPLGTLQELSKIQSTNSDRIVTGINEFNRVLGGGIVRDSVTILSAKPGAGKSTILLQVAIDVAGKNYRVLYASGEESESQIKTRADRIFSTIPPNIWILSDTSMDRVNRAIQEIDADIVIIDSIQTFTLEEHLPSRPGSPTQTMEVASELMRIAKNPQRPRAVFMIGQMNKNEELAGLRALEHLVDTVIMIDGENGEELRGMMATKNRFGSTGEMAFFAMTETGMEPIENPSQFFVSERNVDIAGSTVTVIREGTRPIIVEIESLVSTSYTPYPSRISEQLRRELLNTLISILETRAGITFFNLNVVVKTTGGIHIREQAANLGVMMSIVSSAKNKAISRKTIFLADVGLTGELKRVPAVENRLKEADRMGFEKAFVAEGTKISTDLQQLQVIPVKTIQQVISNVYGKE